MKARRKSRVAALRESLGEDELLWNDGGELFVLVEDLEGQTHEEKQMSGRGRNLGLNGRMGAIGKAEKVQYNAYSRSTGDDRSKRGVERSVRR